MQDSEKRSFNLTHISAQKLILIVNVLTELGISPDKVLGEVSLRDPITKAARSTLRIEEIINVYKNLSALNIPAMGLQIGQKTSTRYYGLYGCTLLSRETLEDGYHFAIKYHSLATRTTRLYTKTTSEGGYLFGCEDILGLPELKAFNLDFQMAINLTLTREMVEDADFSPAKVYLEYPEPPDAQLYQRFFNCPILYNQSFSALEFTKEQFTQPLSKRNPLAILLLMKTCDDELQIILKDNILLHKVYNWVSENIHRDLLSEELAEYLFLTTRTLRRHLAEHKTSFSQICTEVKCKFSKQYIVETQLSIDDIGDSLGFSDGANFRRAFKSWTHKTPTEYRKQYQILGK
jgi:AraC-like DNA-binding protein